MSATEVARRPSLTIPAEYLEDVRAALAAAMDDEHDDLLAACTPADREATDLILRRTLGLLKQLDNASGETTLTAEKTGSGPLQHMIEEFVRVLSARLKHVCTYGPPLPLDEVHEITERLRWAAEQKLALEVTT